MGGCCHDEIAKYVPELAKFIPLHCCNHYGAPMYPVENGMYHIKNSDKSVAIEYLRISDKEYSKLSEAVDDKMYFKYLLFNLGLWIDGNVDQTSLLRNLKTYVARNG